MPLLPPDPPKLSGRDFDPSQGMPGDEEMTLEEEVEDGGVQISSVEINILIYLYLLESNFSHTAFTLLAESSLPSTALFQHFNPGYNSKPSSRNAPLNTPGGLPNGTAQTPGAKGSPRTPTFGRPNGRIERGELIRRLWKGLRWEEVERHVMNNGELYKPACPNPFHLLIPHVCPPSYPSSVSNPFNPPPSNLLPTSPPARRPQAFPPPLDQPVAGPSRSSRTVGTAQTSQASGSEGSRRRPSPGAQTDGSSSKRDATGQPVDEASTSRPSGRSRRKSDGSESRHPSERSASPVKGKEKWDKGKRARVSEGDGEISVSSRARPADAMDVDEEPKRAKARNGPNARAGTQSREHSPVVDSRKRKNDENPANSPVKPEVQDLPADTGGNGKTSSAGDSAKSPQPKAKNNPLWIPPEHVAMWTEHRDSVTCVAWNPANRDILASGSGDGTARLWDFGGSPEDGRLVLGRKPSMIKHSSVESSRKNVTAVEWHPDGSVFATASADGVGRLFTPSGQLQGIMSFGRNPMNALKFSPSGSSIVTAKDDFTICLWGVGQDYNQVLIANLVAHTKEVNDLDWLDDNVFASGGNDHAIHIFHTSNRTPSLTFLGHTDDVTRVKWSPAHPGQPPESRLLASASDDGYVIVWKMPSLPQAGKVTPAADAEEEADGHEFENDIERCARRYVVSKLRVVDADVENKRMSVIAWCPGGGEGRMILAAGGQETAVKLFDALSGECVHVLSGPEGGTASMAFSPSSDGSLGVIAAGGWAGQLEVYRVETGEKIAEYEVEDERVNAKSPPRLLSMAWREDGKQLAVGMHNKAVMVVSVGGLSSG